MIAPIEKIQKVDHFIQRDSVVQITKRTTQNQAQRNAQPPIFFRAQRVQPVK